MTGNERDLANLLERCLPYLKGPFRHEVNMKVSFLRASSPVGDNAKIREENESLRSEVARLTEERAITKNHAERVKMALMNGADETLWRPGYLWADEAARHIRESATKDEQISTLRAEIQEALEHLPEVFMCKHWPNGFKHLRSEVARLTADLARNLATYNARRGERDEQIASLHAETEKQAWEIAGLNTQIASLKSKLRSLGEHLKSGAHLFHEYMHLEEAHHFAALARECEEISR
jgi:chromosome segregation ATPase